LTAKAECSRFSNGTGLLPEQIWDQDDQPDTHMRRGGPTGSANVDLEPEDFNPRVEFTFFWKDRGTWEGHNFEVEAY